MLPTSIQQRRLAGGTQSETGGEPPPYCWSESLDRNVRPTASPAMTRTMPIPKPSACTQVAKPRTADTPMAMTTPLMSRMTPI